MMNQPNKFKVLSESRGGRSSGFILGCYFVARMLAIPTFPRPLFICYILHQVLRLAFSELGGGVEALRFRVPEQQA